jgi:hypothetical protein
MHNMNTRVGGVQEETSGHGYYCYQQPIPSSQQSRLYQLITSNGPTKITLSPLVCPVSLNTTPLLQEGVIVLDHAKFPVHAPLGVNLVQCLSLLAVQGATTKSSQPGQLWKWATC